MIHTIRTQPYDDQKPGTSGLRKKVVVFQQTHYLENFLQALFDTVTERGALVVGGDGRHFNEEAIQIIIRMAIANGFSHFIVGQQGILSTPAVSHLIRLHHAVGGIILSASHNPAGPEGDFGIKFNNAAGSPAPEDVTQAIYARSRCLTQYRIADLQPVDLSVVSTTMIHDATVDVVDSVADYVALMQRLFDFDALREGFRAGRLSLCFDAMHAVTGPYAKRIFEQELGAADGSVINAEPLSDFGGGHPDPNLVHAKWLVKRMAEQDAPILGAASDGDGDRNLILGRDCFVSPSDSLAVLAWQAERIPQFAKGLSGVARSMPTSTALDRVAAARGIPCYETPTGWKFFGNLLDSGRIMLCGEESFGTSGDHVREKDGVWAVLCWLTLINATGQSPAQWLEALWGMFGRSYYCRHDFEGLAAHNADQLMQTLRGRLPALAGQLTEGFRIQQADDFTYKDPTDGRETGAQGIRIIMKDGSRIVYRLSGTGTDAATLRVYLERVVLPAQGELHASVDAATDALRQAAITLADIPGFTGLHEAQVVT